jgi:hypothetical protein
MAPAFFPEPLIIAKNWQHDHSINKKVNHRNSSFFKPFIGGDPGSLESDVAGAPPPTVFPSSNPPPPNAASELFYVNVAERSVP